MTTRVFFFNRLHEGVAGEDYERWVREVDYPKARSIPAIVSYEVVKVDGPLRDAGVPYDYIEVVEITDVDAYRADLADLPGREEFVAQIRSFIGPANAVVGTVIE
jgi:hypothetical protein